MSNLNIVKSCVVPKCKSTTTKAPGKIFFLVPMDIEIRKKWRKAMRKLDPFGDKSKVYCCEDHFDIENDMENYTKYKLVGGKLQLKTGTVPHKFKCQEEYNDKAGGSAVKKCLRRTTGRSCSIKECPNWFKNRSNNETPRFMASFKPRTISRQRKWEQSLGFKLGLTQSICYLHFKEEHLNIYQKVIVNGKLMIFPHKKLQLKENAVPTIKQQFPSLIAKCFQSSKSELKESQSTFIRMKNSDPNEEENTNNIEHFEIPLNFADNERIVEENSDSNSEKSDLNSEKSDLNSEKSDLNSEKSDLNSEISDLNSEKSDFSQFMEGLPTLESFRDSIRQLSFLPQFWLYIDNASGLEFMRMDEVTKQMKHHIRLNEDLSVTVVYSNNEEVVLEDRIESFKGIYEYLKSVERWPYCLGTLIDEEKYSRQCKGVIPHGDICEATRLTPRCEPCRFLLYNLQTKSGRSVRQDTPRLRQSKRRRKHLDDVVKQKVPPIVATDSDMLIQERNDFETHADQRLEAKPHSFEETVKLEIEEMPVDIEEYTFNIDAMGPQIKTEPTTDKNNTLNSNEDVDQCNDVVEMEDKFDPLNINSPLTSDTDSYETEGSHKNISSLSHAPEDFASEIKTESREGHHSGENIVQITKSRPLKTYSFRVHVIRERRRAADIAANGQTLESSGQASESSGLTLESSGHTLENSKQTSESSGQTLESCIQTLGSSEETLESRTQTLKKSGHTLEKGVKTLEFSAQTLESNGQTLESSQQTLETNGQVVETSGQQCDQKGRLLKSSGKQSWNDQVKTSTLKKKRKVSWTQSDLVEAVTAVQTGRLSSYKAADSYNIPRRTLRNYIKSGKSKLELGRKSVLSKEWEQDFVKRLIRFADLGIPLTAKICKTKSPV